MPGSSLTGWRRTVRWAWVLPLGRRVSKSSSTTGRSSVSGGMRWTSPGSMVRSVALRSAEIRGPAGSAQLMVPEAARVVAPWVPVSEGMVSCRLVSWKAPWMSEMR
jgi:hypothetical protein